MVTAPGPLPATPAPIPSRTQVVLEAVKHAILTGRLSPGQALVETELAQRFGVSKTPVREALKTLAGSGLVVMNQYKGVTVRTVDAAMAREVYDVRLLLEPEALRRSVTREASLEAAREALERADHSSDRADRSLANRDFHRALYLPCGNPLLARMLDDLRDQAALVSAVAWASVPSWEREAREHREILRTALAGDADGAARLLHDHIGSFVRRAFPDAVPDAAAPDTAVPERPAAP
ncbi:GntR family transcriptional regulator [Streptomyces sp. WAC 00631]|uniref:GntR family transcriptional regulator n=1 Tax=Streptomyces TaxID=1883 RepID=UPI000F76ABC9|nr:MULTISPECIES: GntR family transcriptional regulator [Streptomyces]MCC5034401.1 GntR family transcriptional regulator [Streptomyces sp. WAC 00631]MCC9742223.1 GntR family transcriptional regulator [Streptomyces sp. MNU89]WSQ70844.1 GntR family transcriptional regulator [Streptomyces xinghaiensis]